MKKTIYSTESQILITSLREGRQSAGLTIRQLAKKMELHHSIVGKIETGERRLDVVEFIYYCDILEIDPLPIIEKIVNKKTHNADLE